MAEIFEATFKDFTLSGKHPRRVVLTVPEGQSTAGGKRATQSISLVSDVPGVGILVAGTVNAAQMTAELRGFPYINETHHLRFGAPLDILASAYVEMLEKATTCLKLHGYTVEVVNQLPEAARRRYTQAQPKSNATAMWVLVAFLIATGVALVAFLVFY